jgi:hypothetical protein
MGLRGLPEHWPGEDPWSISGRCARRLAALALCLGGTAAYGGSEKVPKGVSGRVKRLLGPRFRAVLDYLG